MMFGRSVRYVCLFCRLQPLPRKPDTSLGHIGWANLRNSPRESFRLRQSYPNVVHDLTRRHMYSTQTRDPAKELVESSSTEQLEAVARDARRTFGETLPKDFLSVGEYAIYERLFGPPIRETTEEDLELLQAYDGEDLETSRNVLLRENAEGELEEVEYAAAELLGATEVGDRNLHSDDAKDGEGPESSRAVSSRDRRAAEQLQRDIAAAGSATTLGADVDSTSQEREDSDDPGAAKFVEYNYDDLEALRTHPLTEAGHFGTAPATLQLPKGSLVEPIAALLSNTSNKHLTETAERLFGGPGLPNSTVTPASKRNLPQKPIGLLPTQSRMGEVEGDAFLAVIMPGAYAAVTSILTETRKRLGSRWLGGLLAREGGPSILDVGGGGAGILAMRDVLRAEWASTQDTTGGKIIDVPELELGKGTVVVSSDALRNRVSSLLDNTTFLPRLPDCISKVDFPIESSTTGTPPATPKQYDVVIAPYTLCQIHENHQRKAHVNTLWSLVNPESGVLIILEKGLPRGFEAIAAARQSLLDVHISSPAHSSTHNETAIQSPETRRYVPKETGMIIAPCTNHTKCPMFLVPGIKTGRKDFCQFSQRFIRPPFLQRILGESDVNHDDVAFSYIAVLRGKDSRTAPQGEAATEAAFAGHESAEVMPDTLSLPRAIRPPLKRKGHVVLDVCTPCGKIERWTVPKSFSKQAYRDARKSSWGDLWGLGAKARVNRAVRLGEIEGRGGDGNRRGKQAIEIRVSESEEGDDELVARTGGLQKNRSEKRNKKGRRVMPRRPLKDDDIE